MSQSIPTPTRSGFYRIPEDSYALKVHLNSNHDEAMKEGRGAVNPNTKASQTLRSKRKAAGLQEVRGIWAPPSFHSMLKDKAASLVKGWSRHQVKP